MMIHHLTGILQAAHSDWVVVEVGGVGMKVALAPRDRKHLPAAGEEVRLFCHLHVREDALELYGFQEEEALSLFELLIGVSGVGPKSALSILSVADPEQLTSAIVEGRPDVLTGASGIGKKTAERIVLELKTSVESVAADQVVAQMEGDADIIEALTGLGYTKSQAREAVQKVSKETKGPEARIKEALNILRG